MDTEIPALRASLRWSPRLLTRLKTEHAWSSLTKPGLGLRAREDVEEVRQPYIDLREVASHLARAIATSGRLPGNRRHRGGYTCGSLAERVRRS
jgi:hypothetical protein